MGGCFSETLDPTDQVAKVKSEEIDKLLKRDKSRLEKTVKLLLLGAGESGKSTVVKQMKIIHGDGFSKDDLEQFKAIVQDNLLSSIRSVLDAMVDLGIPLNSQKLVDHRDRLILKALTPPSSYKLSSEDATAVLALLEDNGVNDCIRRGYEYQLIDSAPYFFSHASRIMNRDYIPNEDDVLRSRVRTTGISVTTFKVDTRDYHVVDVGGQRSERRKWIQCFDDVRAVLFVCAMSGYDMTLLEDGRTNRLDESLNLFQAVANNKFFEKASMILFLNKLDLFEEKVANSDRHLRLYFPQYQGADNDVDEAKKFVESEFRSRFLQHKRRIYPHFTTATDTSNIKLVIKVVVTQIIIGNMQGASLL